MRLLFIYSKTNEDVRAKNRIYNGYKVGYAGLIWSVGQVVKTPPFHGGNTGSTPVQITMWWFHTAASLGVSPQKGTNL